MSIQMAKRVSLSRQNTFYRGSIEIEPLGSMVNLIVHVVKTGHATV
jgi:ATP phosphoribosyltransferase